MYHTLVFARRIFACGFDKYRRPVDVEMSGRGGVEAVIGVSGWAQLTCAAIAPLSFLRLDAAASAEGPEFDTWVVGVEGKSLIFSVGGVSCYQQFRCLG